MQFAVSAEFVTSIALITRHVLEFRARQLFDLRYRAGQSVTLVGIAVSCLCSHDSMVPASRDKTRLAAKLVPFVSFSFRDTRPLQCMNAGELVRARASLSQ